MRDTALYFELASIFMLALAGVALLIGNLPGWGLIAVAGLLASLSVGLRSFSSPALATAPVSAEG